MNLKHLVGTRMDVILEHDRNTGHTNYQHVTSKIVKDIECNKDTLRVFTVCEAHEVFKNVKALDIKRSLIIVTFNDDSRTFLDFFPEKSWQIV